jgi:hypothetical protein
MGTSLVGASLLAMVVNDNAYELDKRGALESIASRLAPAFWIACEVGSRTYGLVRALTRTALEASTQTILDLGNRPVAPKEVTRLCTVSFSKSAAVRSDA